MPTDYRVLVGPEGYLLPAAASMEVVLPDKEETLVEGLVVPEEKAMKKTAEKLLSSIKFLTSLQLLQLWQLWRE